MKSKGKRIIGILFSLALMFAMTPVLGLSLTAYAGDPPVNYNLWVGGTQVTNANKDDVLKGTENEGKVSYTPAKDGAPAKLTLNGANITTGIDNYGIYYSGNEPLTIESQSGTDNTIIGTELFSIGILSPSSAITFSGEGSLTTEGNYSGIDARDVTIDGSSVTATSNRHGIISSGNVTINGDVTAAGSDQAIYGKVKNAIAGTGWTNTAGTEGEEAIEVNTDSGQELSYKKVQFTSTEKYPLWVGGTQVTSANMNDVLAEDPANKGKVSFTPAKDGDPAKLTLNGANITTGYNDEGDVYGIYYTEADPLTIESPSGADNKISNIEAFDTGIRAPGAYITLSGKGKLTAEASYRGIKAYGITIDGSNVTAIGKSAIGSATDVVITGGNVTAAGMFTGIYTSEGDITIKDGDVTAEGQNAGINSYGNVIVDGGNIEAAGWFGITSGKNITVNGGTVNATGTDSHIEPTGMSAMAHYDPAGIFAEQTVEIKSGKVTAAGDGYGILGLVKNHIDGTGWTDKAGTAGKTAIAINTDGQDLAAYKKVQFPAKVDPEPTPTPTPSKVSGTATAKMSAKGKTGMTLAWSKIQGAAGYDIYLARCDAKGKHSVLKNVKTIEGNKTFKWTKTGLKKGKSYKACVKAFVYKNGKKSYVKTSPVLHAYSGNVMGKYTNAKSIKVNKTKVVLKKGKAFKIKAKVTKVKKNKKLMPKKHVKTVRYMTTNKNVATVSASGKITAKGKGSCTVIAFAHNGISKSIKVTVK